jgi:penicillin G amidase
MARSSTKTPPAAAALRCAPPGSRPGAAAYFNAAWAFTARNWDEFLATRDHWGAPPLNLLFAGRDGDIGWAPSGFVPVRATGDGLLPVPAGKAHRWTGLLDPGLMPVAHNPAAGLDRDRQRDERARRLSSS